MSEPQFEITRLTIKADCGLVLKTDFPRHNWPVSGGWGYTLDDAVIIDASNETEGLDYESQFIQYRTYEELIVRRDKDDTFSGIQFKKESQALLSEGERSYDKVIYKITAFKDKDYQLLKRDWVAHNGYEGDEKGFMEHLRLLESKMVTARTVCYFDITSFLGK